MTTVPDDLRAIQIYCQRQTGQEPASLGIAGDAAHNAGGGYHVGVDVLRALGTAPDQSGGDYSYTESTRDRAGLTNDASAFDLGGEFPRFREVTLGIVTACQLGDPRAADIREVIYTPDGHTVQRWDRLGRRTGGDTSHLWHTHLSFFRDSAGRRHRLDNVLGLLIDLFENRPVTPAGTAADQEDDVAGGIPPTRIPASGTGSFNIWPVNTGSAGHGPAWLNLCNDTNSLEYAVRIWASKGDGRWFSIEDKLVLKSGVRYSKGLPDGTCCLSISRVPVALAGPIYAGHLTFCVEYGRRI